MHLWTIHPRYLDGKGLVTAWREGLLAQKVLRGETRGYTRHPQLERFRAHSDPLGVIAAYLALLGREATRRGYAFGSVRDWEKTNQPPRRRPANQRTSTSTGKR